MCIITLHGIIVSNGKDPRDSIINRNLVRMLKRIQSSLLQLHPGTGVGSSAGTLEPIVE